LAFLLTSVPVSIFSTVYKHYHAFFLYWLTCKFLRKASEMVFTKEYKAFINKKFYLIKGYRPWRLYNLSFVEKDGKGSDWTGSSNHGDI